MIDEYGVVVQDKGGKLAIEIGAEGSCAACPVHDNCYQNGNVLWVPRSEEIGSGHLRIGDHVHFTVANASVLKVSALVYGVPLVAVLAGIAVGYLWLFRSFAENPRVGMSVLIAAALFVLSGVFISRLDKAMKSRMVYSVERLRAGREETAHPIES
ncbi:MAG TPA: SoxR reducing system RseC family protein [Spirochaetia bacterium]|nr:SoxR reducing system RseC family protein [Spirochaetia bacterium]